MQRRTLMSVAWVCTMACATNHSVQPVTPNSAAPRALSAAQPTSAPVAAQPSPETAAGTLLVEGAPEVPAELVARLHQYLETRHAAVDALSADGRSMLIRTRFAETAQVHRLTMPLGARTQLTFDREPIADAELVTHDREAHAVLFLRDTGGNEDYQIYRLDLRDGTTATLTDGKSRHEGLKVARGGALIAYANNARNGRDMDVYVADGVKKESARRVLEAEGSYTPLDFSRDGKWLLVQEFVSILESRLHLVDLEGGASRLLTPAGLKAAYRGAFFSADGQRVYATSDREGEMVELYEGKLGSDEVVWTSLTRDIPWNVEQATLSPDGRTIAFTTNEEGYSVLHLLDTRTKKHRLAPQVPRGIISGLRYAEQAPVLGLTLQRPTSATDAYTYDTRAGRTERWTDSEMGGLDPKSFVEPELIRYPTFDNRTIPAFVYRPRGKGPFPVLVDIHGGPESQARPGFHALAQYLARERGIATVVPNVRGSDGYGKTYLALDNGTKREDSVGDIGALLEWVAKAEDLDEGRVAVMGGSYGGYMTLASLVHFGARIKGGIDVVGIANFVSFLENTRDYRRDLRRAEYGDESNPEMRTFLARISPLAGADRIDSALLVAHGKNDPRVPLGEAVQIAQAVRARGRPVWTVVATNEGHGFQKKENRDRFMEIAVLFLERVLAP